MTAKTPSRRGFTLVELLVVISIIGVLVGLLLPAVQSARESARRMQCQNNLKQLSLAVRNYDSSMKSFPPAITTQGSESPVSYNTVRPGWTIAILPYMEQQNLYDLVDRTQPMNAASNLQVRSIRLAAYICPTETNSRTPCNRAGDNWARGNYGANVGMVNPQSTAAYGAAAANDQWIGTQRGVMGANAALKMAQIKDGTSNTIMLMELRTGLTANDIRGTWAMGQCGASALCTTANNVSGSGGPNVCIAGADDQVDSAGVISAAGDARLIQNCMRPDSSNNWQAFPRSSHSGGVFVALCDGSVRFISDFVQSAGANGCCINCICTPAGYGTWQRLVAAADGMVLDGSKF